MIKVIKPKEIRVISNIPEELSTNLIEWEIKCNEHFKFVGDMSSNPEISYYIDGRYVSDTFDLNEEENIATLSHEIDSVSFGDISEITVEFRISTDDTAYEVEKEFSFCTSNIPDIILIPNYTIDWTITADPNYIFETVPHISYHTKGYDYYENDFVISEDKKTATLKTSLPEPYGSINIKSNAIYSPSEDVEKYGSITPYIITLDNLKEFSNKRFFEEELPNIAVNSSKLGWDTLKSLQTVDLGVFVSSLKRAFFKVERDEIKYNIYCGNYNTNILADVVLKPVMTFDFGEVQIPSFNESVSDFENTLIELFIPFVGFQTISNDYINTKLRLIYKIDLIASVGVAFLYSNDMLIDTINCNPFKDIIYKKLDDQKGVIGSLPNDYVSLYGLKPYLKLKWYKTINNNIYNSESKRAEIKDLKGWNKIIDVEYNLIDDTITKTEVEIINSLLNRGIQIL